MDILCLNPHILRNGGLTTSFQIPYSKLYTPILTAMEPMTISATPIRPPIITGGDRIHQRQESLWKSDCGLHAKSNDKRKFHDLGIWSKGHIIFSQRWCSEGEASRTYICHQSNGFREYSRWGLNCHRLLSSSSGCKLRLLDDESISFQLVGDIEDGGVCRGY